MTQKLWTPVRETKALARPPVRAGAGVIAGYASLFGRADLGGDVVMPGAFAGSLRRRGARGIRMLFQHDPAEPIGAWEEVVEDRRGLHVRGRLNLAVARAREVWALLRDGGVDGLSIGFKAERARRDPLTGIRRLDRVDLWEISVVTFPMLPGARAALVKGWRPAPALRAGVGSRCTPGEGRSGAPA